MIKNTRKFVLPPITPFIISSVYFYSLFTAPSTDIAKAHTYYIPEF